MYSHTQARGDGLGDLQSKLRRAELEREQDRRRGVGVQQRAYDDRRAAEEMRELERLEQREAELKRALEKERMRQRGLNGVGVGGGGGGGGGGGNVGAARGPPISHMQNLDARPDISRMSHREKITYLKAERQRREDAAKMAEFNRARHADHSYAATPSQQQAPHAVAAREVVGQGRRVSPYVPPQQGDPRRINGRHEPEVAAEVEEEAGLAVVDEEDDDEDVAEEVVEELENDPWMQDKVKTIREYKDKLAKHTLNAQLLRMQMGARAE